MIGPFPRAAGAQFGLAPGARSFGRGGSAGQIKHAATLGRRAPCPVRRHYYLLLHEPLDHQDLSNPQNIQKYRVRGTSKK
jgi:hypothetical protein